MDQATEPPTTQPSSKSVEEYRLVFDHYRLSIEDTTRISDQRRMLRDFYVGLNTVFLSGIGLLVSSTATKIPWYLPIVLTTIAIVGVLLNNLWRTDVVRYRILFGFRSMYQQDLEIRMRDLASTARLDSLADLGMSLDIKSRILRTRPRSLNTEFALIYLFTFLYVVVALASIALVFAVQNHLIPPLS